MYSIKAAFIPFFTLIFEKASSVLMSAIFSSVKFTGFSFSGALGLQAISKTNTNMAQHLIFFLFKEQDNKNITAYRKQKGESMVNFRLCAGNITCLIKPFGYKKSYMQNGFFSQQFIYGFFIGFIRYATIYRAYRSALRFFMKALAFGAFTGHYIINIRTYGSIALIGINFGTV